MSAALPPAPGCGDTCVAEATTLVPGTAGAAGAAGAAGTNGVNAYTTTTAPFTMPAMAASVTVTVVTNAWMAYGQIVAVGDPAGTSPYASLRAGSKTGTTQVSLTNIETAGGAYSDNVAPGTIFPTGTIVSPGGQQGQAGSTPATALLAANNLNDVAAAATSRTNLGLGTMAVQNAATVAITGGTVVGITDLAVADGGTGASSAAAARTALGAAALGANTDITSLGGLTTPLAVARGGTGATSAGAALTALGAASAGANTTITSLAGLTTPLSVAQGGTAGTTAATARAGLGLSNAHAGLVILMNKQLTTVDGGTFTTGAWRTRVLNTEVYDDLNLCTLAANQFTLLPGEYYIHAWAPAYKVNKHQIRLYNVTTASVVTDGYGTNAYSGASDNAMTPSLLYTHVDIGVNTTFQLEHYCETTQATTGFGAANSFGGSEIYSIVVITRETD